MSWYAQEHWEGRSTLSRQVTKASENLNLEDHTVIHQEGEAEAAPSAAGSAEAGRMGCARGWGRGSVWKSGGQKAGLACGGRLWAASEDRVR